MARQTKSDTLKLDQGKLLGFRNLPRETATEKNARETSEFAFNKIGSGSGESSA